MKEVEPCVRHTYVDAVRAHVRAQGVTCDNVDIRFRPQRMRVMISSSVYTLPLAVRRYEIEITGLCQ